MLTAAEFMFEPPAPVYERRRPHGVYAQWVAQQPGTFTAADMAEANGICRQQAAAHLTKLMYQGQVEKVSSSWRGLAVWRAVK